MKKPLTSPTGELLQQLLESSLPHLTGDELDMLIDRLEEEALERILRPRPQADPEPVLLH